MFKLIAFLFMASNPSEPFTAIGYGGTEFASKVACMDFLKAAPGKKLMKATQEITKKKGIVAKFACIEAKDEAKEDNTI